MTNNTSPGKQGSRPAASKPAKEPVTRPKAGGKSAGTTNPPDQAG